MSASRLAPRSCSMPAGTGRSCRRRMASKFRQDELLLGVGNRYAPSGYAWVFPWGADRVRVGVGLLHDDTRSDPRKVLSTFVNDIHQFDVNLGDFEITESHFGLIPAD